MRRRKTGDAATTVLALPVLAQLSLKEIHPQVVLQCVDELRSGCRKDGAGLGCRAHCMKGNVININAQGVPAGTVIGLQTVQGAH